jgi:hypothetical protein
MPHQVVDALQYFVIGRVGLRAGLRGGWSGSGGRLRSRGRLSDEERGEKGHPEKLGHSAEWYHRRPESRRFGMGRFGMGTARRWSPPLGINFLEHAGYRKVRRRVPFKRASFRKPLNVRLDERRARCYAP